MRLALAAGFLAQRTFESPAEETSNKAARGASSHPDLFLDGSGKYVLVDSRKKRGRRGQVIKKLNKKVNKWTINDSGVLRNEPADKKEPVECDPKISEHEDEPDVGILACGHNYYCAESQESLLGGVCTEYGTNMHRFLQIDTDTGGIICDPNSESYLGGGYYEDCNCSNFDLATRTGTVECVAYENYCFVDSICARVSISITVSSVEWSLAETTSKRPQHSLIAPCFLLQYYRIQTVPHQASLFAMISLNPTKEASAIPMMNRETAVILRSMA